MKQICIHKYPSLRILTPQNWLFWGPGPLLYRFKPLHWRVPGYLGIYIYILYNYIYYTNANIFICLCFHDSKHQSNTYSIKSVQPLLPGPKPPSLQGTNFAVEKRVEISPVTPLEWRGSTEWLLGSKFAATTWSILWKPSPIRSKPTDIELTSNI